MGASVVDGKTILITGASQGLGRHLCRWFAARGAYIIAAARTQTALESLVAEIAAAGGSAEFHVADLRDAASLRTMVDDVVARRHIDILINNAADVLSKPLLETSLEEIDAQVRANVTGCIQLIRLVAPHMIAAGGGTVVNVSSLAGYKPNPTQTVYSATKTAVNGISAAVDAELRGKGIHVVNVALSSVGDAPHQVSPDAYARALERAIARRESELFLSPVTRALMRVYAAVPALRRLRS